MIIYLQLCFNLCKLNESFKKTDPDLLHCQDYSSGYNSSFSATIFSPPHNHLLLTSSSPPPDHLLTSSSPPPDHLLTSSSPPPHLLLTTSSPLLSFSADCMVEVS